MLKVRLNIRLVLFFVILILASPFLSYGADEIRFLDTKKVEEDYSADTFIDVITDKQPLPYAPLELTPSNPEKIELEYRFLEPKIKKIDKVYHSIDVKGTYKYWDEPGLPLLPIKTVKILIPQGRDVENINVISGRRIILDGEFKIEYSKQQIPISRPDLMVETAPNLEIYTSTTPFPEKFYSEVSTQYFRGYKILIVNLFPVQWSPIPGKISYYPDMRVVVTTAPTRPSYISRTHCRNLPEDISHVKKIIDNPSIINTYTTEGTAGRIETGTTTGTTAVTPLSLVGGPYEYVIVTTETLKSTFQTLVDLRVSRGITAKVVTVDHPTEGIYANYDGTRPSGGTDNQTKIRNFIIDAYTNWNTQYVLLGGDADANAIPIIPHRGVYGKVSPYIDNDIPCDLYYGCLDGTWDYDADGIYGESGDGINGGEVDLLAEVYVGRIPADNATEAANQINKIIAYENSQPTKNALLVGQKLDNTPTWGGDYKDEVYTYFPATWSATRLYERDGTFSTSAVINAMNGNQYHIVNNMAHANNTYDIGLYNSDVDGLTNTTYFLAYSQGCYANAFDNRTDTGSYTVDSISEHFTAENGNAAFAYIGNTRYGWYVSGSTNGASQQFDKEFFDAIFNEGKINLGIAFQDSKEDLIGSVSATGAMRWCYFELCLMGDPLIFTPNYGPNVIGKIYKDSAYSKEDKFFNRTETVYIEAYVVSAGAPLTGATVTATLKLSDGSTVTTLTLVDVGSGYYRNSWDSTGAMPDVYLVDINVTDPPLNTKEYFHLYPQSGVSSYRLDYDEDGNKEYILENKHLIAVYDGRPDTDKSLLYLSQKDTDVAYKFAGISDPDTKGRSEPTTTNMREIKFYAFSFLEQENLLQASLGVKVDTTKGSLSGKSCMFDDDDTGTVGSAKGCAIKANFTAATSGTLEFWARCRAQTDNSSFDIMLEDSSGNVGPDTYFLMGDIGYYDGSTHTIMAYTADQWYHFKVIFNCATDKMDIYIDDMLTPKVTNANFRYGLTSISRIEMDTGRWLLGPPYKDHFDPLCYVDDIDIYSGTTHFLVENFEDDTAGSNPGAPWTVTEDSAKTNVEISNSVYHETKITTTFDLSTQMKTEDVDYLVYKLSGFDANIDGILDIFSPLSGSIGSSANDDQYYIGDGVHYGGVTTLPASWTNFNSFLTDEQKYVAIYDNSYYDDPASGDPIDNNVISWIYFPDTSTVNFKDVGCWYETGKEALRIRYNTTGASAANQAEYILAFTQGDYNKIQQWMSTVAGGNYPSPNFMTPPSVLGVSVNPNTWPIGVLTEGEITQSTEADDITVTNTGSVNETFTLKITLDGSSWLPGTIAGVDTYVMWGLFCGTDDSPSASLFQAEDIILAGSPTLATDYVFGDPSLSRNGVNIVPSDFVDLWFQFQAPTQTADKSQQSIIVTVGAQQP